MNEELKVLNNASTNVMQEETIVSADESTEKREKVDYRVIVDMIKEMEEQYKLLQDVALSHAEMQYNLTKEVFTGIIPITKEEIETMGVGEMREFLSKYLIEDQELPFKTDEEVKEAMVQLKQSSLQLLSTKNDIDEIKAESNNMLKDYFNYLSTPVAQEKRAKRLEALKDAVDKTEDNDKKASMIRMIKIMEEAQNLSFVFERFDKLGKKEVKSIVDSFFDIRRGSIVVERFKSKIVKFGFDHMLYRYFFNLEELFLDEKYHVFNNLFLFIYMRMVSCSDPYSKKDTLYVQSLTSAMANLIYHRFDSTANEEKFKNIIEKIDSNFMEYHDRFEKENVNHPTHPKRIEADNKRNTERRKALIAKMDELKITGYDENASADDLQNYMNEHLDKMINDQIRKDKETSNNEETEEVKVDIIEPDTNTYSDNAFNTKTESEVIDVDFIDNE